MPRAILFDAGNTLIYADPARMAEIFREAGADADVTAVRTAERAARRVLHDAVTDGHQGTEPELWRAYFLHLFEGSGVPGEAMEEVGSRIRDVHRAEHLWTGVADGTAEALEGLADAGYRLGVISNADGRVEGVLERVGLRDHFEFVVDSDVVGVAKPDPAIFHEGCRRLDLPPEDCLYVGDLYPVDYLGARGAGLDAVLLDPEGWHAQRAPGIASLGDLAGWLRAGEG